MTTFRHALKTIIGEKNKKELQHLKLRTLCLLGVPPFTGHGKLDKIILPFLSEEPGFFIEAGGNDGFSQSNTYYLEKVRGWDGILVEPIHELASMARRFRDCTICECAIGAPHTAGDEITLSFSDLKSEIGSAEPVRWNGIFGPNPRTAKATLRTLSDIIAEHGRHVDLLSLDVEGYELPVLDGLDLNEHAPTVIVVETAQIGQVYARLASRYGPPERLTHHDYLFQRQ